MLYEKLKDRLNQLIEMGERVLSTKRVDTQLEEEYVNNDPFYQWKAGALSFLKVVLGNDSTHFQEFQQNCKHPLYLHAFQGQSILKAAKEDIEGGYLQKLETLVSADIFTDFLEMAKYLVEQGCKDPAASLIGAVLENGLRKIAKNNGIKLKSKEDISSLNQKLADDRTYNRLTQERIKVWKRIRNDAVHGKFSEYTSDLVKEMLYGVRDFLGQYL